MDESFHGEIYGIKVNVAMGLTEGMRRHVAYGNIPKGIVHGEYTKWQGMFGSGVRIGMRAAYMTDTARVT